MKRKTDSKTHAARGQAAPAGRPEPEPVDDAPGRIEARPDGYHWLTHDGRQEFGPFETLELAQQDMDAADGREQGSGLSLQEAEREIGIREWFDPETGEPAEGSCPPLPEEE